MLIQSQGLFWPLTNYKGIFHTIWPHAQYITGREKGGRMLFGVMVFVFPGHHCIWWGSALLEVPDHGKQWITSWFCCPVCMVLLSPLHFLYLNPRVLFCPSRSPWSRWWGSERVPAGGLGCWLGLNHGKCQRWAHWNQRQTTQVQW